MKKLLALFLVAGVLAACSKDSFKTVPQVKIESISPEEAFNGSIIEMLATVTDQEGDLQDSVIVVRKRFNAGTELSVDSTRLSLKGLGVPNKQKIELRVTVSYGRLYPEYAIFQDLERNFDREFSIGLVVLDNAGNRSEYVESEKILLRKFQ
ncbi:MAG: hypothetical protein EOO14_11115 [Chitinophagaceae bacterium]|nr:MAG: hypothetical protein EOO14_11115 [Chitinophagaceae bacterium]